MSLIKLRNISLKFDNKPILNNFNLEIKEGEKILIVGKSGSGKSTILKLLLGFTKIPTGEYLYNEKKVKNYSKIRNNYAFVNQDVTLRDGKVKNILKEIAEFSYNNFNGKLNTDIAKLFEFDMDLLNKNIDELSGGERQRLGILIAIQMNRPVFLLDEVTSALDIKLKEKVVKYFKDSDKTVIVVSHDHQWLESGFRKVVIDGND